MMTFNFLDDYRLDFSVRSLLGSRSRLQDVPKIAQLIEARLHKWFDERAVEPRFQEIALPSLWPRKKNTRGPDDGFAESGSGSFGRAKGKEVERDLREETPKKDGSADGDLLDRSGLRQRRQREDDDTTMPGSMPGVHMDVRF